MEELEQRIVTLENINNSLQEEIIKLSQKPIVEISNYTTVEIEKVILNEHLGENEDDRLENFLKFAVEYKILFI